MNKQIQQQKENGDAPQNDFALAFTWFLPQVLHYMHDVDSRFPFKNKDARILFVVAIVTKWVKHLIETEAARGNAMRRSSYFEIRKKVTVGKRPVSLLRGS